MIQQFQSVWRQVSAALVILLLSLAVAGPCGQTDQTAHLPDLMIELKRKVTQQGLFIAEWRVRGLGHGYATLFPFSADPRTILDFADDYLDGWFSRDGRTLMAISDNRLVVLDLDGNVFAERAGMDGISFATLSPDSRKCAFSTIQLMRGAEISERQRYTRFYYGDIGSDNAYLLAESSNRKTSDTISWGPDGKRVVIGIDGEVRIYALGSSHFTTIGKGDHPTWSPDGQQIAFRSAAGSPILFNVSTGRMTEPLASIAVLDRLDWSPDSEYLLFSETHDSPPCASTRLVVLRLRDNSTAPVLSPCFGVTNRDFGFVIARKL